jgi:rubredoxin
MKSSYDNENNCRVYTCPVCGYVYHEYYDYTKSRQNPEEPFIAMAEVLLYDKPRDYAPNELVRLQHYACPKCGILQIDTSDV